VSRFPRWSLRLRIFKYNIYLSHNQPK
jgi:hypothetical protein